ncbi:MAG: hypothetical protein ACFFCE_19895 [Promethearchaeota archaeon]
MTYNNRIELYKSIEDIRNRPLLVYVTSIRSNASGLIAPDIVSELAKQLIEIPKDKKEIDILIISNGGDALVSWRIICMLRERFEKIGALLPYAAYSAATLIALGADEIIMHPFSNLGPVDPQLTYYKKEPGQAVPQKFHFGPEDLKYYLDFIKKDVGISDQKQLQNSFEIMCKDVGSIPIGIAKRVSHLSSSLSKKLLKTHMEDEDEVETIVESLNTSFYDHGYPLGKTEARSIGLKVIDPDDNLEKLMWNVWEDIENEMQCNWPFNPLEIILKDEEVSKLIETVSQIQIPQNLPPQLLQNVYQKIIQSINIKSIPPVEYENFIAILESTRCRSEYKTKGKINALRMPDMNIKVNTIPISQGWKFFKNED